MGENILILTPEKKKGGRNAGRKTVMGSKGRKTDITCNSLPW